MPVNFFTLITGASEGLGKSMALECAKRGMNLVLVALPDSRLGFLKQLIEKNFGVQVVVIEKDLTTPGSCRELYEEVRSREINVNILINNAGIGNTILFSEGSAETYEKMILLNVLATTVIARLFLPDLKRNPTSYILNVGSLASFFYLPRKPVYGSSKSYIHLFTKCLRKEVRKDGISVSELCPGGINTNISVTMINRCGSKISRLAVMYPEEVAERAITGLLKGEHVIVPGVVNKMFILLNKLLPSVITDRLIAYGMRGEKTDQFHAKAQKKRKNIGTEKLILDMHRV